MRNKNGNLNRAVAKIKFAPAHYYGYLTPSEIIAVMENGGEVMTDYGQSWVDWAKADVAAGKCRPRWFYFNIRPNSVLSNKLGEMLGYQTHNKRS